MFGTILLIMNGTYRLGAFWARYLFGTGSKSIENPARVYVLNCGAEYKIGKTKRAVAKRVKELQTGNSQVIRPIIEIPTTCASALERDLHKKYSEYRIRKNGEWFALKSAHINDIRRAVKKYDKNKGLPVKRSVDFISFLAN